MSHWTKVQLKLEDRDLLKEILKKRGLGIVKGRVRGYGENVLEGDVIVLSSGRGVKLEEDGSVVGDLWFSDVRELIEWMTVEYAKEKVKRLARKKGWKLRKEMTEGQEVVLEFEVLED